MAGLVPAIHAFNSMQSKKVMDARDKRGHDGTKTYPQKSEEHRTAHPSGALLFHL
jgi:hypothetical protein